MRSSTDCLTSPPQKLKATPGLREFEQAVESNLPVLLRIARRLTWPDRDLGADLVQEAVLKGLRALNNGKLKVTPQIGAWLKQAVYLEFLMHKREAKRLNYLDTDQFDRRTADSTQPFAGELSPEILDALADLPDNQRILVILVDLEQHEYHEVSQMLDIPMGTVRSRLSRARWKLANRLHHLSGNHQ